MMTECDALIIGGGPAGAGAAGLLARWGHRVLLVDRRANKEAGLPLSIPPSTGKPLAALGLLEAFDNAGFQPWRGNIVCWGARDSRIEAFPADASGRHVVREQLGSILLPAAGRSGADVRSGLVRDVELALDADEGRSRVSIDSDGCRWQARARFVLDCSGRAGILARCHARRKDDDYRTIALAGRWRTESSWGEADETHTIVAAYADGWAWSIPTAPGVRYITVMVDPVRTGLTRGQPALEVYRAELAKVPAFEPLLARGALEGGPWGHDATTYSADRFTGPGFLLVGDAGSFIDPLSSSGVKKALASAWLAAVAVNTALARPAMREEAFAFYERREHEVAAGHRIQSARFAAEAGAHPFWRVRSSADVAAEADDSASGDEASIVAAYEDLRARPTVSFRCSGRMLIEKRALVRGREIVLDDHLILPERPLGVRYLQNVDLLALLRLAPRYPDAGRLYDAMAQAQPSLALPDFLRALSFLLAKQVLTIL